MYICIKMRKKNERLYNFLKRESYGEFLSENKF